MEAAAPMIILTINMSATLWAGSQGATSSCRWQTTLWADGQGENWQLEVADNFRWQSGQKY